VFTFFDPAAFDGCRISGIRVSPFDRADPE
jgi:hypothetical protein